MTGPYIYKVRWWDDISSIMCRENGITFADSFSEAVEKITHYYGEDDICDLALYACEPNETMTMPLSATEWNRIAADITEETAYPDNMTCLNKEEN